jgi:hypothetical protein
MFRSEYTSRTARTTLNQSKVSFSENAVFIRRQTRRPPFDYLFPFECEAVNVEGEIIALVGDDTSFAGAALDLFQEIIERGGNPQWVQ